MTTEYQPTPEEEACRRLFEGNWEMLSGAARTVLKEAELAAHATNLVHNYCFQPEQYEEAMDKMRLAAVELTGRDRELLVELWRSALAAAASIDPDDHETPAGYKVVRGDVHWYYRMASGMVEEILQEKKTAELREKAVDREPEEDLDDLPF